VSPGRLGQAGERHRFALRERFEKCFKLGLVRMVRHIPGIQRLKGKRAPVFLGCMQVGGMKLVVEQTAFAANQVRMEVIRLVAID
jgi:hypothetical protein